MIAGPKAWRWRDLPAVARVALMVPLLLSCSDRRAGTAAMGDAADPLIGCLRCLDELCRPAMATSVCLGDQDCESLVQCAQRCDGLANSDCLAECPGTGSHPRSDLGQRLALCIADRCATQCGTDAICSPVGSSCTLDSECCPLHACAQGSCH